MRGNFKEDYRVILRMLLKTEAYILFMTFLTGVFGYMATGSPVVGAKLFVFINLAIQPVLLYVFWKGLRRFR